jgi:uroporphyrinogen-III synthase
MSRPASPTPADARLLCLVTRPAAQAAGWVERLHAAGLDAAALPLIEIDRIEDPAPLLAAWAALPDCAFVMFVSANAVAHFFAARPTHAAWPAATRAGSTGPGTTAALHAAGVPPASVDAPQGPRFDADALWAQRLQPRAWAGRQVLIVRGQSGRDWLAERLAAAGARVQAVAAYRRHPPRPDAAGRAQLAAALAQPRRTLWLFSSAEAVRNLGALAPGADWSRARALATHPRIEDAARALGFGEVRPAPADAEGLIAEVRSLQSLPP